MINYIEHISALENLMLAWRKLERSFNHGDVWYDELCMSAFKMNLVDNLLDLGHQIRNGSYKMHPISPIPFPKGAKDGDLKVRQSFFIDFRDQLVWVAVFNVIGREFDILMPAWSFGNRQYVSMWMEADDKKKHWVVGNHRNTARYIYRKWTQSWPYMRKRITVSLKRLARLQPDDFDDTDNQVNDEETRLDDKKTFIKLEYLKEGYFPKKENKKPLDKLYWIGLDLTEFYQTVIISRVKDKIIEVLNLSKEKDCSFVQLLEALTLFKVDYSDFNYNDANEDLELIQLKERPSIYQGLPTGLIVAGMLANIFMIDLDNKVQERLSQDHEIIHFRYVDDHVIVSSDAEKLYNWMVWYQEQLIDYGLKLNISKLNPHELLDGILNSEEKIENSNSPFMFSEYRDEILNKIEECSVIDPKYPTPLMTQTLQKISMLQGLNLNMLTTREFEMVFGELQSLLVAELSEQEIKKSTRISFACTMLTRLIMDGDVDYEKVHYMRKVWLKKISDKEKYLKRCIDNGKPINGFESVKKIDTMIKDCTQIVFNDAQPIVIDELKKKYSSVELDYGILDILEETLTKGEKLAKSRKRQVFNMLMHALDKVPDKVRVWIRAFFYCVYNEPKQINKLYYKLLELKGTKLHMMSVEFIYALLNSLCAESIIKTTSRLVVKDYQNPGDIERDKEFLDSVIKIWKNNIHKKIFKNDNYLHFFIDDSEYMLSKAFAFYDLFAAQIGMPVVGIEESFFSPRSDYHSFTLDSTFWLLWIVDSLASKKNNKRRVINELMRNYIKEANPQSGYYKSFFKAYLKEISITGDNHMILPDTLQYDVNWNNDLMKYTFVNLPPVHGLQERMLKDADNEKYAPATVSGHISLSQWIDSVLTIKQGDARYELVHSEILPIMIILSVIKTMDDMGEDIENIKIHPDNFFIDDKAIKKNWNDCLTMIDKNKLFDVKYVPNNNLDCLPYDYPKFLNNGIPANLSRSYGLGIIFLQLLSKRKILPWSLNSQEVGFEWQFVLHRLQGNGRISSLNYRIISSCLSPRQRENNILRNILNNEYVKEVFRDNPEIENWHQLRDKLKESLLLMRNNLISVANEAHRQLIIMDLD